MVIAFLDIKFTVKEIKKTAEFKCILNDITLQKIHASLSHSAKDILRLIESSNDINEKWLIFKQLILSTMGEFSRKVGKKKEKPVYFDALV